jgi:hypothetical protein
MNKHTSIKVSSLAFILILAFSQFVNAQNQVEDAIKQMSQENVSGYLQPFLNGFGANLNSGFSGTAKIEDGITIRLDVIGMANMIGTAQETYSAIPPEPFSQQPVSTATVFGGQGATLNGPSGTRYRFQNGQLNMDYFPLAAPQITIGNFYNTQLIFRFFTYSEDSDVPDINMFGIGLRHGLNQYFGDLPVDLAAGVFYQNFTIGDIMKTDTFALTGMASKDWKFLSVYGGAQYEYAGMNLNYTFESAAEGENPEVDFTFNSDNNIRAFIGLNLNFKVIHLRTDVSLANVPVLSASIGIGI